MRRSGCVSPCRLALVLGGDRTPASPRARATGTDPQQAVPGTLPATSGRSASNLVMICWCLRRGMPCRHSPGHEASTGSPRKNQAGLSCRGKPFGSVHPKSGGASRRRARRATHGVCAAGVSDEAQPGLERRDFLRPGHPRGLHLGDRPHLVDRGRHQRLHCHLRGLLHPGAVPWG